MLDGSASAVTSMAGMLSPHGRCHTFDNRADGFARSEAVVGAVLSSDSTGIVNMIGMIGKAVCSDGQIHPSERQMVRDFMTESNLAPRDIVKQLQALGWTVEEWDTGVRGD